MKRTKQGVSLVEIIIGVMLLAFILVPCLNAIIGQTKTVNATRDHAQAAFIADKILETAKACAFHLLDADRYQNEPDTQKKTFEYKLKNDPLYNTYEVNGITYKIDTEYTSIDPINTKGANSDTIPNVYAFRYSIQYVGKDNRNHNLNVQTIISQR